MRIATQTISSFLFLLLFSATAAVYAADDAPRAVVEGATKAVLSELGKLEKEQRTDEVVRQLVMDHIAPVIDQTRIAKGALGKHWRRADKAQRQAFIERFRELQIRTYAGAFKAFNGEQFKFEASRFNNKGNRALVKGKLIQANGQTVPIDFRLYQHKKTQQWLVYDAVVAGLGMVKTYRQQLSERLQSVDMTQLLAELSTQ